MISILSDLVKKEAVKKYIQTINSSINLTELEILANQSPYNTYPKEYLGECISLTKGFQTQRYLQVYASLKFNYQVIALGLKESEENINNSLEYLSVLEKNIKSKTKLEERLYESLKNRNGRYKYLNRVNYFEQFKISRNDTLKHPELIDYYYSKDDICSTEHNKISLPDMQSVNRTPGIVSICVEESSVGSSKDPVSNVTSNLTSHQYVIKSEDKITAKLTYILDYKRLVTLNRIAITDASLYESSISEIYYKNNDGEKVNISYSLLRNLHKKVLLFDNNISAKRFYIKFTQVNYIDKDNLDLDILEKLSASSNSSFDRRKDDTTYYFYEFNIDKIQGSYSLKKKKGLFVLNKTISLIGLESIQVDVKGLNLDNVNTSLFLKQSKGSQEEVIKADENNTFSVNQSYTNAKLIFIIDGVAGSSYQNFYIDSIDIKGS